MRKSKVLDRLVKRNPTMFSMWLWDENGYELLLERGFQYNDLHGIAGNTVSDILSQLKDIRPCADDCVCKTWE